ncbi:MAG TPA: hypothetical protein VKE22_01955 [Haliangiales bacterium]|nr:hypothetical protein [Haliangiales bacterium]
MKRFLIVFGLVAGCGASTPDPATAQARGQFASNAECAELVEHLDNITFLDRTLQPSPSERAAQATTRIPALVQKCTIMVSKHDYQCLMAAHDAIQADACSRRIE